MHLPASCPAGHGPAAMDLPLKLWIERFAQGISPASLSQAYSDWLLHLLASPSRQAALAGRAAGIAGQWWAAALAAAGGRPSSSAARDKRFASAQWRQPPFDLLAQAFLLNQEWWADATRGVRGVSRHHEDQVAFMARQWLDMLSPSNFPATNPEVLRQTFMTGGANLAGGFLNWARDAMALAAGAKPRGVERFVPGESVALTPGKVVLRNELAELIQYESTTAKVLREPAFIVPSWIMKFYILDLTPQDSLVKYLVDRGHTVFIVSWRNPRGEQAGLGLEDYLRLGVLEPAAAIAKIRPRTGIHAAGYCLGGTLLAIAAAQQPGAQAFKTLSLLAAQTDFSEPGELGLFIDESQIAFLEDLMAETGYLDGRRMAGAFQLINSKDLVWSKLVHEYLMGGTTPMTAMRAWNADATRMPARMHGEYLRHLYLHNDLAEGRFRCGAPGPVDLARIRQPMFVVATQRDHVSPWPSVYRIHRLVNAGIDFVLASGGHNAGIVSPPAGPAAHPQASYRWARDPAGTAPAEAGQWLEGSTAVQGSWWPRWSDWLRAHSSGETPSRPVRTPAPARRQRLGDAPGRYVMED